MKLWTGYDINHKLFPSEASHALKGIRSIGESRAVPDARNPLAYHLLLTQQSLEDWKGWVENKREGLLHFVSLYLVVPRILLRLQSYSRRKGHEKHPAETPTGDPRGTVSCRPSRSRIGSSQLQPAGAPRAWMPLRWKASQRPRRLGWVVLDRRELTKPGRIGLASSTFSSRGSPSGREASRTSKTG